MVLCCWHSHGCCPNSHNPFFFPMGQDLFFGGQHCPLGQGIMLRGWTTRAACSHPCQQLGWASGFPSGVRWGSMSEHPAASGMLVSGFFQWIWPLKGADSGRDGELDGSRLCSGLSWWAHVPSAAAHHPHVGQAVEATASPHLAPAFIWHHCASSPWL